MTDDELDTVADKIISKIRDQKHDFWIDPEKHYQDHHIWGDLKREDLSDLQGLLTAYRAATSLFWKAFLGFAILGSLTLAALGLAGKK